MVTLTLHCHHTVTEEQIAPPNVKWIYIAVKLFMHMQKWNLTAKGETLKGS